MRLPPARIAELSNRPGVLSHVASNFLGSMAGLSQVEALANLELDARAYGWTTATGRAIQQGIMEAVEDA